MVIYLNNEGFRYRRQCYGFIFLFILLFSQVSCEYISVVEFQSSGIATTNAYLQLNKELPQLEEYTICARVKLKYDSPAGSYILSYRAKNEDMHIGLHSGEIRVYYNVVTHTEKAPVLIDEWFHFCCSINESSSSYTMYFGSKSITGSLKTNKKAFLEKDGAFLLGQFQQTIGGTFRFGASFAGQLAEFGLYKVILSNQQIKNFLKCESLNDDSNTVTSFSRLNDEYEIIGDITVKKQHRSEICKELKNKYLILPELRVFPNAKSMCQKLGSKVALPKDSQEMTMLYEHSAMYESICSVEWGTSVWIGAYGNLITNEWESLDGSEIDYHNLDSNYAFINKESQCISQGNSIYKGDWYSTSCTIIKTCAACEVPNKFILRGLCKETIHESILWFREVENLKPVFRGDKGTRISWNNETWLMTNRLHPEFIYTMEMLNPADYPMGLVRWKGKGDKCSSTETILLLTACINGSFTCDDGTCIKMEQRYDMLVNCPDASDEKHCQVLRVDQKYDKHLPPPTLNRNETLDTSIDITVISIRSFSILEQKLAIDMLVELQWRDRRIKYANLHENENYNVIQRKQNLWLPKLKIIDDTFGQADIEERGDLLLVIRNAKPLPDDIQNLSEDIMYDGGNNTLKLIKELTVSFQCQFDLQMYPFDTQVCSLTFFMAGLDASLVNLIEGLQGALIEESKILPEYKVSKISMDSIQGLLGTRHKMILTLKNKSAYFLGIGYLPSFLLAIIAYSTFFINVENFSDRVMVNITSMLVLTTLFTQTSTSVPMTAYLKLIDVWYTICFLIDFCMFIVIVIIEVYKNNQLGIKITKVSSGNCFIKKEVSKPEQINNLSQILFPIIIMIFAIAYFVYVSLT